MFVLSSFLITLPFVGKSKTWSFFTCYFADTVALELGCLLVSLMVDYSPTSIKPFNYYSHADYWHTFKKSINIAWNVCWKNSVFIHVWRFCYARCIRSKRLSPEVMKFLTASWLLVLIGIIMHQEKYDAVNAIIWKEPDIYFTSERQSTAAMLLIWWISFFLERLFWDIISAHDN